jgi:ubiquinone/menaquinone biosynthesis C-methylase UbiE
MQAYSKEIENQQPEDARKSHWEKIYSTKGALQVSWYSPHLETSLKRIEKTGINKAGQIIDVGGGASTLVDDLVEKGYENISILDISHTAMEVAKARLGQRARDVQWIAADVTRAQLPQKHFDIWHDRAVFHFLTNAEDRRHYLDLVKASLKSRGHFIIATFAEDGPSKCSGLEVVRYSIDQLTAEIGNDFELVDSSSEIHKTPFHIEQKFLYSHFKRSVIGYTQVGFESGDEKKDERVIEELVKQK